MFMRSMSGSLALGLIVACSGDGGGDTGTGGGSTGGSTGGVVTPTSEAGTTGGAVGTTMDGAGTTSTGSSGGSSESSSSGSTGPGLPPEEQPKPADGAGVSDPPTNSLHNHRCAGIDWQRIHGWLLLPHAAPEIGPADEMARCVERYAGWVTNEADAAGVSRASVYAALAASGQCDAQSEYDGEVLPGSLCTLVHPELTEADCVAQMAGSRAFGISTLARALGDEASLAIHDSDVPLMGAYVGQGAVDCGGDDRWRLVAPAGYVDRYVAAYNAYKAQSAEAPDCNKKIVVTVALYTGLDDPGAEGVAAANGCWTYERVSKTNQEWKICNYDGTVTHEDGNKWVFDDTNTQHEAGKDKQRILACQAGVSGRGYVYMTNRGSGWPKVVTDGVAVHFAEIYSGQFEVDDQFGAWKNDGAPGEPMINLGEPATTATKIGQASAKACAEVEDGGYLGVYVYPESLRGGRMSALVEALNDCTGK